MKAQRRLDIIEMTLTPKQVVNLILKEAHQQGTFWSLGVELARRPAVCSPRTQVTKMVERTVRESMKSYAVEVVNKAVQQASQEADLLYLLAIDMNTTVLASALHSARFVKAIARHLRTILRAALTADELTESCKSLQYWLEELLVLEGVVIGAAAEYFDGQQVLFNDAAEELEQQLGNASQLVECFNPMAEETGLPTIDLQVVRTRLEPAVKQQIANKTALARAHMLITFGEPDAAGSELVRILSEPDAGGRAAEMS